MRPDAGTRRVALKQDESEMIRNTILGSNNEDVIEQFNIVIERLIKDSLL